MTSAEQTPYVVFIHGGNAIDGQSFDLMRSRFRYFGFKLVDFSVTQPNASSALSAFLHEHAARIFCFLSSNYWALNIRLRDELLNRATGIPLVIFLQDHPLHFLPVVSAELSGSITFALGTDGAEFVANYYPYHGPVIANPSGPSLALDRPSPQASLADFLRRENALLCPMNLTVEQGENIDDVWNTINQLPTVRRDRTKRTIDAALYDCVTPLHAISQSIKIPGGGDLALEDLFHVLNFVKLWRRTRIIEMLIDLPILFSSNYVPAMLARKSPEKFRQLTVPETVALYPSYRFVVNATPMVTGIIHDRVAQALHNNSVCITDANGIIKQHFTEDDMVFIDYTRDDLANRVTSLLDNPDRAFAMTEHCRENWTRSTFTLDAYQELIATIARRRESPTATI